MADNLLGALVGAAVNGWDGDSMIAGAIEGSLAERAIKLIIPLAATVAIGWGLRSLARRALGGREEASTPRFAGPLPGLRPAARF